MEALVKWREKCKHSLYCTPCDSRASSLTAPDTPVASLQSWLVVGSSSSSKVKSGVNNYSKLSSSVKSLIKWSFIFIYWLLPQLLFFLFSAPVLSLQMPQAFFSAAAFPQTPSTLLRVPREEAGMRKNWCNALSVTTLKYQVLVCVFHEEIKIIGIDACVYQLDSNPTWLNYKMCSLSDTQHTAPFRQNSDCKGVCPKLSNNVTFSY